MSLNLAVFLEQSAKSFPDKIAVILDDIKIPYAQLNGAAKQFANVLAGLGVQPGDNVAIMIPNVPYFPVAYYGILYLGATVVPLSVLLKAGEVEYHLNDSDSVALVVWEDFLGEALKGYEKAAQCRELIVVNRPGNDEVPAGAHSFAKLMETAEPTFDMAQPMPDDTAVIIYTSGTTGRPKGAELTHFNLFYNALCNSQRLADTTPEDVALAVLPLFHSFGQTCMQNACFSAGGAITLLPRFDAGKVLEIFERDKVTIFAGVPTMYFYLLNHPDADKYDVSSLRLCTSGGAAMPVEVMKAFEEKFNVTILEGYGLSETSPTATFNVSREERKPGSIGLPLWGVDAKIFDDNDNEVPVGEVGEVVMRGHLIMKGYYNKPEATAEAMRNGWFHSGDLGKMDEDGFFYIVDRKKDMVIRGGYNVYPREVEEVVYAFPGVAAAAVVGVPHEALGEEVKAFVMMNPEHSATEEEIIEFCKQRLAAYKYPRIVEFRDTLPMGATGKILKRELKG